MTRARKELIDLNTTPYYHPLLPPLTTTPYYHPLLPPLTTTVSAAVCAAPFYAV
ncbi:MAG: hypothetical protein PVF82_17610 [Gammaproteobacteria bacterium]|jgi:hypothetical protein